MKLHPIGVIHTPFTEPRGTPIQAAVARGTKGRVVVQDRYAPALQDLTGFERIWLVYWFDRAPVPRMLVVPFLDDVERGLFATRAPGRPNPLGISAVRLLRIEDNVLHVADVDILDGTPLLDIKPYVPRFDCFPNSHAGWLDDLSDGNDSARAVADERFNGSQDEREGMRK